VSCLGMYIPFLYCILAESMKHKRNIYITVADKVDGNKRSPTFPPLGPLRVSEFSSILDPRQVTKSRKQCSSTESKKSAVVVNRFRLAAIPYKVREMWNAESIDLQ
jgi:hypothetical protein